MLRRADPGARRVQPRRARGRRRRRLWHGLSWSTVTGRRLARLEVSGWPLLGLATTTGELLLATDWPTTSAGFDATGTASVINFGTGRVIASYQSPQPYAPPINPGAALSPDGRYLFWGALGLAPPPPGGTVAVYQVAGGQMMASLRAVQMPHVTADAEFPAQPWSPDGTELVVGNSIYRCDACLPLAQLQAAAAARIAWYAPLSAGVTTRPRRVPTPNGRQRLVSRLPKLTSDFPPRAVHDPGEITADLAAAVALGGDCLADVAVLRDQPRAGRAGGIGSVRRLRSQHDYSR